jgi:uncharacterized membrane protein
MKLTGQITSVVGCGGEGGCSNVLGSQWSQWFLIPISAVSACFYLGLIVLTYKLSKSTLTIAAFLLIMAAAWFMGLQVFVIKSFCPWCFTTHLIGLLTAGAIFWKGRAPFKVLFCDYSFGAYGLIDSGPNLRTQAKDLRIHFRRRSRKERGRKRA